MMKKEPITRKPVVKKKQKKEGWTLMVPGSGRGVC